MLLYEYTDKVQICRDYVLVAHTHKDKYTETCSWQNEAVNSVANLLHLDIFIILSGGVHCESRKRNTALQPAVQKYTDMLTMYVF